MPGKFFDERQVGERITHQPSRTVAQTDNLLFSAMTHNMQPLHLVHLQPCSRHVDRGTK